MSGRALGLVSSLGISLALAMLGLTLLGDGEWVREHLPTWRYLRDLPLLGLFGGALAAAALATPIGRSAMFSLANRVLSLELRRPFGWILASVVLMAVLTIGRSRNFELGDASVLIEDIPYDVHVYGQNIWPDEVLARLSRSLFYKLVHTAFGLDVVQAFTLSSAIWGVLYAAVLIGIGRTLFPGRRIARALPLLFGFAIGNVQLFFGYIEVYSGVTVCLLGYVWQAYRHLKGQASIAAPAAWLAIAIGFYLPAGAALPSLLLLCFLEPQGAGSSRRTLRRIGIALATGLTILTAVLFLYLVIFDYGIEHLQRSHATGRWTFLVDRADPDFQYRTLDVSHLRDFATLMLRVAGAALGAWATSWTSGRGRALWREPTGRFELAFAGGLVLFCFLVHPDLGPERDWDLLSFGSLGLLLLGSRWLAQAIPSERELARAAAPWLGLGFFLTGSFVIHNAARDPGDWDSLASKERWWVQEWGVRDHRASTMHEFAHLAAAQLHVQLAFEAMVGERDDTHLEDLRSGAERARLMAIYREEPLPSGAEIELRRASAEYREATRINPDNLRTWRRWLDVSRALKAPASQLRVIYDGLIANEPDPQHRRALEAQRAQLGE